MRKSELMAGIVLLSAVLAVLVVAIKLGVDEIQHIFDSLDSQIGTILGVGAVVLLLCSAMIATAVRGTGRRENELWRQSERARIYQAMLEALANRAGDLTGTGSPFSTTLFLIGSAPVVKEYRTFIHMVSGRNAAEERVRKQVNRLMLAMRRDVGESTFGLEHEDWSGWLQSLVATKSSQESNGAAPIRPSDFDFAEPAHRLSSRA
jgi:hypothetical protein